MNIPSLSPELADLLDISCLGELESSQAERLEELLRGNLEDARHYVRFVYMNAMLERFEGADPKRERQLISEPMPPARLHQQSPAIRFLGSVFYTVSKSPLVSTLVVAATIYGVFGFLAWDLRPARMPSANDGNSSDVAMISSADDVSWSDKTMRNTDDLAIHSGESLKIESGTIELELNAGTKLVIEGPADWSVEGSNSVSLQVGKLWARVPEKAIGFRVQTATATVVDLGTEFAVEAKKHGATEIQVFKGKIELQPGGKAPTSAPAQPLIMLEAGQARRIDAPDKDGVSQVHEVPLAQTSFAHASRSAGTRRLLVVGAMASSELGGPGGREVCHLYDNSGLSGERHTCRPVGNMWATAGHDTSVKGEFVLFDFGMPRRFESMKVWNYNEFVERGVKQADIYVSNSGKWDPLKQPDEWKLVVHGYQFTPATGKDDYAQPDVVPLGGCEGRYVAIVIDDHFAPEPAITKTNQQYVGLSEVQFFGEKLDRKPTSSGK